MTEWVFEINAPGMTSYHKAGLLGLAVGLQRAYPQGTRVEPHRLIVSGIPKTAAGLYRMMELMYPIDRNGLIDFPFLSDWDDAAKATWQNLAMSSFLQHPQSRSTGKERITKSFKQEDQVFEYSYLPMLELKIHRSLALCEKWEKHLQKKKPFELSSLILPGAMKRHNAVIGTELADDPELYPLLLFTMVGCIFFQGIRYTRTGEFDPKTGVFVVVPKPRDLKDAVRRMSSMYQQTAQQFVTRNIVAAGDSDAVLQASLFLDLRQTVEKHFAKKIPLSVVRFGKVGWSQQKTRTGVYHMLPIEKDVLEKFDAMSKHTVSKKITRKDTGNSFYEHFFFRGQVAENLVNGRPWYQHFSTVMSEQLSKKIRFWTKELNRLVLERRLWKDEDELKQKFVLLMQDAVKNRYGKAVDQAKRAGASDEGLQSVMSREYERMRIEFAGCRTREQLRQRLMDFMSRTRGRYRQTDGDGVETRDILLQAIKTDWEELRDLCLLALASYQGADRELDNRAGNAETKEGLR